MSKKVAAVAKAPVKKGHVWRKIWKYRGFYIMFLPVFVFALIFFYLPMIGIRYAFFDYNGIKEATFVGLKHFQTMFLDPFKSDAFKNAVFNTI